MINSINDDKITSLPSRLGPPSTLRFKLPLLIHVLSHPSLHGLF
jgi:hypothetical protein